MTRIAPCARLISVLLVWPGSLIVWGQDLPAVGDGRHIWILPGKADAKFKILHRADTDMAEPGSIRKAIELRGTVVKHGMAAAHDQLWLIFADMGMQSIRAEKQPGPSRDLWRFHLSVR